MWRRIGGVFDLLAEEVRGFCVRPEANKAFGTVQSGLPIELKIGCLLYVYTTIGLLPVFRTMTSKDQTHLRDRFLLIPCALLPAIIEFRRQQSFPLPFIGAVAFPIKS